MSRVLASWVAAACVLVAAAPGAAAAPSGSPPPPTPTAPTPTAPTPTSHGRSPGAPDPHPPAGGIGPHGEQVGGAALTRRGLVLPPHAPALPHDLTARAWVVADLDTGAVLAARDPHGRYQPASIQKLLTTDTLLPRLPGDRVVTVSRRAANTEGSHAGLVGGGRYTVDQLFQGLLLVSGNDCAEALAEAAGGRAHTVALMNSTARGLGAYDTYVQTPSGLDGWQQLTSAYDMTLFLRAAVAQPRFLAYDHVTRAVLPKQPVSDAGPVPMWNQNVQFLHTVPGALAAKTGFTDAAQHTFAGAIERNGHRYGVVLLRAQRWPDDQWVQATRLVNWATKLPRGAVPVGRLAAPAAPHRAATVRSSAAPGTSTGASSTAPSNKRTSSASGAARIILIIVLFGGVLYLVTRRRTDRGPKRPPLDF